MRWFKHGLRFLLVTVGIVVLTSLTIDATDALNGSQSALSILARKATEGTCPAGMTEISLGERSFCIDVYENSLGSCPASPITSVADTQTNINDRECMSVSQTHTQPWVYISYHQAKTMCARRGGRLPTAKEWYEAALGTPDTPDCNINGGASDTGSFTECNSARGVYDMVGNVWEWVEADITDGQYDGRTLPAEGFVTDADANGVAIATGASGESAFGNDYFWANNEGVQAMMRGGFYGSKNDSGIFAVHTKVSPSFSSVATGFRCVVDL